MIICRCLFYSVWSILYLYVQFFHQLSIILFHFYTDFFFGNSVKSKKLTFKPPLREKLMGFRHPQKICKHLHFFRCTNVIIIICNAVRVWLFFENWFSPKQNPAYVLAIWCTWSVRLTILSMNTNSTVLNSFRFEIVYQKYL